MNTRRARIADKLFLQLFLILLWNNVLPAFSLNILKSSLSSTWTIQSQHSTRWSFYFDTVPVSSCQIPLCERQWWPYHIQFRVHPTQCITIRSLCSSYRECASLATRCNSRCCFFFSTNRRRTIYNSLTIDGRIRHLPRWVPSTIAKYYQLTRVYVCVCVCVFVCTIHPLRLRPSPQRQNRHKLDAAISTVDGRKYWSEKRNCLKTCNPISRVEQNGPNDRAAYNGCWIGHPLAPPTPPRRQYAGRVPVCRSVVCTGQSDRPFDIGQSIAASVLCNRTYTFPHPSHCILRCWEVKFSNLIK